MKSIKHIALTVILTVSAFCAVLYTSCSKDACKGVTCQNGGTCSGGNCTCVPGYEGTSCESLSQSKFTGKTWTASDKTVTTSTSLPTYVATFTAGATVTDINIGDFSGKTSTGSSYFVNDVKATLTDSLTITIASQAPDNDGYTVSGTGSYNAATKLISWTYTLGDPTGTTVSYTGSWQ